MPHQPDHPIDASQQQRRVIVRLVRMAFFILITTVALVTVIQRASDVGADRPAFSAPNTGTANPGTGPTRPPPAPVLRPTSPEVELAWWVPVAIAVGLFGAVVLIDLATPNKKISSISGVLVGLLAGVLVTVALSAIIELALKVWLSEQGYAAIAPLVNIIKPLLGVALCYFGITTILQTQDDFRLVIPYVEFAKQIRGTKPLVLDTSALIDARIADLCATGLIQAPIIIPRFVVAELQTLSDLSDKMKRSRGRRGLEVITRLQRLGTMDVTIDETPVASRAVDQMLVELAQRMTGRIVTTDLGLSRIAQIQGVIVINMHEIAAACKPALIPGEQLALKIIKPGEQAGQGVGYLDDGTMVVVDHAAELIGMEAGVLVTSTIQTTGGRMVFGRVVGGSGGAPESQVGSASSADTPETSPETETTTLKTPTGDWTITDQAALPPPEPTNGAAASSPPAPPAPSGPFPPKPPLRKPPSLRNPRR